MMRNLKNEVSDKPINIDNNVDDLFKIYSNFKILSNILNGNYDKNKKVKNDKSQKKFLNKKRNI